MNCYEVENPANGRKCTDDVLGEMVYNASDGTWEKTTGYTQKGNSFSFNLNTLPGNQTFLQRYGMYLAAAGVFVVVLVIISLLSKKKK